MLVLRYDLWFRYSFNLRDFSSISTSAPAMAETTNGTAAEAPADAGEKLRSIVRSSRKLGGSRFPPKFVGAPKYNQKSLHVVSHRIHGTGIFTYMWLILMVNVGKYISPMDPYGFAIFWYLLRFASPYNINDGSHLRNLIPFLTTKWSYQMKGRRKQRIRSYASH